MSILDPVTCLPQFRAGAIKVFAVMAKSRTANAPEVPTVDEAGAPSAFPGADESIVIGLGIPG
jgi:tripartite-type tricarboxylate transporter receptor subunit TctC